MPAQIMSHSRPVNPERHGTWGITASGNRYQAGPSGATSNVLLKGEAVITTN